MVGYSIFSPPRSRRPDQQPYGGWHGQAKRRHVRRVHATKFLKSDRHQSPAIRTARSLLPNSVTITRVVLFMVNFTLDTRTANTAEKAPVCLIPPYQLLQMLTRRRRSHFTATITTQFCASSFPPLISRSQSPFCAFLYFLSQNRHFCNATPEIHLRRAKTLREKPSFCLTQSIPQSPRKNLIAKPMGPVACSRGTVPTIRSYRFDFNFHLS